MKKQKMLTKILAPVLAITGCSENPCPPISLDNYTPSQELVRKTEDALTPVYAGASRDYSALHVLFEERNQDPQATIYILQSAKQRADNNFTRIVGIAHYRNSDECLRQNICDELGEENDLYQDCLNGNLNPFEF